MTAIAAVVIGGTSLFGGAGSMIGTIAGSVMLGALANILQLNNVNASLQLLATGAIIVLAAALQTMVGRRGKARCADRSRIVRRTNTWEDGSMHLKHGLKLMGAAWRRARCWRSPAGAACAAPLAKHCGPKEQIRDRLLAGQLRRALSPARQQRPDRGGGKAIPQFELQIADGAGNDNTQTSQVDNFVTQGVDLLMISPFEAAPLTPAVARAMKAGIPVIELDRQTNGAGQGLHGLHRRRQLQDRLRGGQLYRQTLLPDGGDVAVLEGLPSSTPGGAAPQRLQGRGQGKPEDQGRRRAGRRLGAG